MMENNLLYTRHGLWQILYYLNICFFWQQNGVRQEKNSILIEYQILRFWLISLY